MKLVKRCSKCGITKDTSCFANTKRTKDGCQDWCKQCRADYYAERKDRICAERKAYRKSNVSKVKLQKALYRIRNIEKCRERDAAYYAANKEARKAADAAYRAKNKDKISMRYKRYYEKNKEKVRRYNSAYVAANPATINANYARRRASKLLATPAWANHDAIRAFYDTAQGLNLLLGEWHHVDHIVPLQSKFVCGLHVENNLQVLMASENLAKKNLHWPDMPKENEL